MAYNTKKGSQQTGDIHFEGDPNDTKIDFENDSIKLKTGTGGITRLEVNNSHVSASGNISGSQFYGDGSKLSLGNTGVTGGSYTYTSITVDAEGRISSAGNGAAPSITSLSNAGSNRVITSAGTGQASAQSNLTFNGSLLTVTGKVSATNTISGSNGIHVTGSDPHIAIGRRRGFAPNSIMLNVKPHDTNNKLLLLCQQTEASGERTILAVTGSGRVVAGGAHLEGVFNVSGSTAETLISAKSDTAQNAFTLKGNGDVSISGSLTVSGSVRAKQLHMTTHKYDADGTNAVYVRFDSDGADQPSPTDNNKMVAPYSGQLIKVLVRGTAAGGNTGVAFHRNTNGSQNLDPSAVESVTVNMSAANTSYTFNFTDTAEYGPGDIVGIKVNPSSDPGIVVATAVWEFDHNN